jgi:hypothetical protein
VSKEYEFNPPYKVQVFRDLMTSKGVILGEITIPPQDKKESYGSFSMTFDNKNYLVVWITPDGQDVVDVTRYGANDSTPFIKLFQELGHDIEIGRDL